MPERRTTRTSQPREHLERLSRLEGEVSQLDEQLSALSTKVDVGFDSLRRAISEQRTPVGQLAGWATVCIALVAAILWPQLQTDDRHQQRLDSLTESYVAHISDGHPQRIMEQVDRNREDIDSLREKLETHMSGDGHPTAISRLNQLDKLLDEVRQQVRSTQ